MDRLLPWEAFDEAVGRIWLAWAGPNKAFAEVVHQKMLRI
jgi:hypothetical protein